MRGGRARQSDRHDARHQDAEPKHRAVTRRSWQTVGRALLMATKRTLIERGRRAPPICREWWALLHDEPIPEGGNPFEEFAFDGPRLWGEYGESIVAKWSLTRPGCRPSHWWLYSAPEPCRRR